jgi:hypothetical protein
MASALSPEWNGGIYYAAQRRSAVTEEEKDSTASIAILYESKWKNAESARAFLRVYAGQLPRKYSGLVRRTKDEADGDEQVYTTNEGDVLLSIDGTGVFVSEGFPVELARKLREMIGAVQSEGPTQVAGEGVRGLEVGDPGMSLVGEFSSAGMMKVGLGGVGRYPRATP